MALSAGERLGGYEILSALGAGGMGEVYRARDPRLNRDVALKILPESFAHDAERVARFTREAQVLAALNHPHIAAIYGLEQAGGAQCIVLELVDGGTLSDRIARGPLPLDESLTIARQIADALEAAHEKAIVHRDLKPANVALSADGAVKVLDFGLAKDLGGASSSTPGASVSPTLTFAATQVGVVLGTAAYMAPEQAKGRAADRRSDVWAFGCVLYEMLTGKRVFDGGDVSDTLAFVLTKEPDWSLIPPAVPASIQKLVRRCLERDRKRRLTDIGMARLEIDEALAAPAASVEPAKPAGSSGASVAPHRWPTTAAVVGLAIGATLVLALWSPWRSPALRAPVRLSAELGSNVALIVGQGPNSGASAVLSPDGSRLAFVARNGSKRELFIRRLDQLEATALSGTEDAGSPFFSPDGQSIGFFAINTLKKVSVAGGAAVTLATVVNPRGGWWGDDGFIAFASDSRGAGLMRVSESGGKAEPLSSLAEDEVTHRWPQILPGARALLYTVHTNRGDFDDATIVLQALPSGRRTIVQHGGYYGRYLQSGHIVYVHDSTLFAVPFDLDRLMVTGQAVPVLQGVTPNAINGGAQFSVSNTGTFVYVPGDATSLEAPIQWVTSDAKIAPLRPTPTNWRDVAFSPDGQRLAFSVHDGKQADLFIYDWLRDIPTRLTFDSSDEVGPAWTPDGRRIAFSSNRDKTGPNLYWQRADGTGDIQRLTESKNVQFMPSWHPSGKVLAFSELNPGTSFDIMILQLEGDESSGWRPRKPTPFLNTPVVETQPAFSPDGRWLAYTAVEAGRPDVFVRPYPGPGGKFQVSSDGGTYPTWSRTRHELMFATPAPDDRIMTASYTVEGESFRPEKPRVWSEVHYLVRPGPMGANRGFDLHPDGVRVALAKAPDVENSRQDKVTFIFNFFDELRRIAPGR
jgi:Tol biopolymer transport system component